MWEWIKNAANTVGDWISDAANWVGDTFFGGSHETNITNANVAAQNLQFQKEANDQNIAFQKWANEYNVEAQKWMNEQNINFQTRENEITRAREDNSVQRAAADMTAAGLSKTLAAGSPASAAALSAPQVSAPQVSAPSMKALNNEFKMQRNLAGLNLLDKMLQLKEDKRLDRINKAQVDQIDAQTKNIEANTVGQNNSNSVFLETHQNEMNLTKSQIALNYSNRTLNNAREELERLNGKYRADFLQAEINKMIADEKYTNIAIDERSHAIAEIIARTNKLNKETENLVEEITYRQLQQNELRLNISYAERNGIPVGAFPGGLAGMMLGLNTAFKGPSFELPENALDFAFVKSKGVNRAW